LGKVVICAANVRCFRWKVGSRIPSATKRLGVILALMVIMEVESPHENSQMVGRLFNY